MARFPRLPSPEEPKPAKAASAGSRVSKPAVRRLPDAPNESAAPQPDSRQSEPHAADSRYTPDSRNTPQSRSTGNPRTGSGSHTLSAVSGATNVVPFRPRQRGPWGRRIGVGLVVVLILSILGVVLANVTPWMRVETVQVEGNKFVQTAALTKIADSAKGTPLPRVDMRDLESKMEQIPGVQKARVLGEPPHGLKVVITERSPVAQVKRGSGIDLIDSSGKTITTVKDASAYKLPTISASTASQPEVFKALTQALSNVPDSILRDMQEARAKSPDSIELLMNSGVVVVWGNQDKAAQKAATLQAFLKAIKAQKPDSTTANQPPTIQTIDVSVPDNPVTR